MNLFTVPVSQLTDVVGQLDGLVAEQPSGCQPQEKHPAVHQEPEEEAQEEKDQVLAGVQAWRSVSEQRLQYEPHSQHLLAILVRLLFVVCMFCIFLHFGICEIYLHNLFFLHFTLC